MLPVAIVLIVSQVGVLLSYDIFYQIFLTTLPLTRLALCETVWTLSKSFAVDRQCLVKPSTKSELLRAASIDFWELFPGSMERVLNYEVGLNEGLFLL